MRVLVVEDDEKNAAEIRHALDDAGYEVDVELTGPTGLARACSVKFDVIVLDRMLPSMDGLTVLAKLRDAGVVTPVLILSALSAVDDRVEGLRAGGDDYLSKPFEFSELSARIHALARRSRTVRDVTKIAVGRASLDLIGRHLEIDGEVIKLLPKEFSIVEFLMKNHEVPLSKKMIFEAVWGYSFNHESAALDVHISKIRKKMDSCDAGQMIQSVRNVGFVFRAS
ncbi:response regulator transcription factor [Methylobacterium sp. NEAU K]|uniref:response regulator transcription factor n=1 Tax=Methylobacterium sp. NEAU K TaxID=3064946 RepID=UPI002733B0F6|nr:response regulator transcription factor [Methylobacterium sp. NEAU K]MDP4003128.1 response regulator transcription factor [Methylobacterium sp. NEAU K]